MTFTYRPAVREQVGLLISLAGGTGSGKTYSAMMLAKGLAGDKPFAVLDTEAGRAKHYADQFKFDHGELTPPFRPERYAEAIKAADAAGYPVIVVDSASHEHAGEGGLLEWHDEELQRMAGDDWKRRESCKMAAWIKPKTAHKQFVNHLLQIRAHLILCFRAEEKIEMVRDGDGKMQIKPKVSPVGKNGWLPICEKNLPFEMTASFLLLADNPGVPHPIKLQEQHRIAFQEGKKIDEAAGASLAEWARGGGATASSRGDKGPASAAAAAPAQPEQEPGDWIVYHSGGSAAFATPEEAAAKLKEGFALQKTSRGLQKFRDRNVEMIEDTFPVEVSDDVIAAFNARMTECINAEREAGE